MGEFSDAWPMRRPSVESGLRGQRGAERGRWMESLRGGALVSARLGWAERAEPGGRPAQGTTYRRC